MQVPSCSRGGIQRHLLELHGCIPSTYAAAFGARMTIRAATLLYLLFAGITVLTDISLFPVAFYIILYAINTARFWRITDKKSDRTRAGWSVFLKLNYFTGFIVTLVLIYQRLV